MPIHEYQCDLCGQVEELIITGSEEVPHYIPCLCGGAMDKLISKSNIRFGLGCSFKDGYCKTQAKLNYKSKMEEASGN